MPWGSIPQEGMGSPVQARAVLASSCQEDALRNASLGLVKKDEKLEHSLLRKRAVTLDRSKKGHHYILAVLKDEGYWLASALLAASHTALPNPSLLTIHHPSPLACHSLCLSLAEASCPFPRS